MSLSRFGDSGCVLRFCQPLSESAQTLPECPVISTDLYTMLGDNGNLTDYFNFTYSHTSVQTVLSSGSKTVTHMPCFTNAYHWQLFFNTLINPDNV